MDVNLFSTNELMFNHFQGENMRVTSLLLLILLFLVPSVWAGSFSLDLNDHSTQIGYAQKLDTQNYGDTVARARYLYNDDTNTNLFGINGGVVGAPGNVDGLRIGLDVALNGGQTEGSQKLMAVGLGVNAEYLSPMLRGLGVDTHLVYSPSIFSFMDSEDYLEWGIGASYLVLPNAKVTLAYQKIEVDVTDFGDRDLDDTVRLGIKFDF